MPVLLAQMTPLDTAAAAGQLEADLKLAFEAKRETLFPEAGMQWDVSLSYLLMPLLVAYEQVVAFLSLPLFSLTCKGQTIHARLALEQLFCTSLAAQQGTITIRWLDRTDRIAGRDPLGGGEGGGSKHPAEAESGVAHRLVHAL